MSVAAAPSGTHSTRTSRAVPFRIVASLLAIIFVIVFGAWKALLAPWLVSPDQADHGWQRTPELHIPADAASGVLMMGVGIAAILLVIQPFTQTALVAWLAFTMAILSVGVAASTLVQGQGGFLEATVSGAVMFALLAVPLMLLRPDRRGTLPGGAYSDGPRPSMTLVVVFILVGMAALAGTVGAVWWRLSGGVFENSAEDDAIPMAMLGLSIALGCALCAGGRRGWPLLARLLAGMIVYCVTAGMAILLH